MGIEQRSSSASLLAPGGDVANAAAMRVVGITAIVLAVSMVGQNVMFGATGAPGYGDPLDDVFDWHAQNRLVVAIAVAQEALHVPLLLGFLSGLHGLVAQRGGAGAVWSRLALAAGATVSAIFALYSVLWIGTVLAVGELADPNPTFELAWQLHAAAFALSLPALGATVIGAAAAAHTGGLTPRWQLLLGVAGGILWLAAGLASLEIAEGSALLFVGLPGLAAWIVWLLATGIRMMRGRTIDRASRSR